MPKPVDLDEWRKRKHPAPSDATDDDVNGDERDSQLPSMRQNAAAAVAVIVLLLTALWLFDVMHTMNTTLDCLQSGRTNCNPIKP